MRKSVFHLNKVNYDICYTVEICDTSTDIANYKSAEKSRFFSYQSVRYLIAEKSKVADDKGERNGNKKRNSSYPDCPHLSLEGIVKRTIANVPVSSCYRLGKCAEN